MTTALAPKAQKALDTTRYELVQSKAKIAAVLPPGTSLTADRVVNLVMAALWAEPKLLECTPDSIIKAVILGSRLGLAVDGAMGSAYLVPFKDHGVPKATLIPGYRGLIDLARRGGDVKAIRANVVYDCDRFVWREGSEPSLEHEPVLNRPKDAKPIAAYSVATLSDYQKDWVVIPWSYVQSVKKNSQVWRDHEEQMARKTAIRYHCKTLPQSPELAAATLLQAGAESGANYTDAASEHVGLEVVRETPAPASRTEQVQGALEQNPFDLEGEQATEQLAPEPTGEGPIDPPAPEPEPAPPPYKRTMARKAHHCTFCGRVISKGEAYLQGAGHKAHLGCEKGYPSKACSDAAQWDVMCRRAGLSAPLAESLRRLERGGGIHPELRADVFKQLEEGGHLQAALEELNVDRKQAPPEQVWAVVRFLATVQSQPQEASGG